MIGQQSEKLRQKRINSKQAITMALEGNWEEAVTVNKDILANFPDDVDAYNRLGRAYLELGEYAQAREAYQHAAALDPYNAIAKKNLQRLSYLKEDSASKVVEGDTAKPQHFIEEVGKSGVVRLWHLATKEALARVNAGDNVELRVDNSRLVVQKGKEEYIGQVEPRYAQRLIRLMQGGNKYSAAVTSVNGENVIVLIRETYQDPSQADILSFLPRGVRTARNYLRDRMLERELEYGEEEEAGEEAEEFGHTEDTGIDSEGIHLD